MNAGTSNQERLDRSQKRLVVGEGCIRDVVVEMLQAGRPFGDKECDDEFEDRTEEGAMLYFNLKRWHRRTEDCIRRGDKTIQFGGDK